MLTKDEILSEIRRTADSNGGRPLGLSRFSQETGIALGDILGKHWARWGDAIKDAGLLPNQFNVARTEEDLLSRLAALVLELGHFPSGYEINLKARQDSTFPHRSTFLRRYESTAALAQKLRRFCEVRGEANIASLCVGSPKTKSENCDQNTTDTSSVGYVYLVKHGTRREYKIGRTKNTLRREGEIRIELPHALLPIHQIKTDDPAGVEQYWHTRFAAKRMNGEWFQLDATDVKAFKKWRRIF